MRGGAEPPERLFARAVEHHRAGRLGEAQSLYEAVLRGTPEHAAATHALGIVHAMQGRAARAVELLERARTLRADDPAILADLGAALMGAGRFAEALAQFDRLAAIAPRLPGLAYNRSLALRAVGRLPEALEAIDRALAERPGDFETLGNRGGILLALHRAEEALADYRRALVLAPGAPEAHANCGYALALLGRPAEALSCFERALALRPDFATALYGRAEALLELARPAEALAGFEATLRQDPTRIGARRGRADALRLLGRIEEAVADYERAASEGDRNAMPRDRDLALTRAVRTRRDNFLWTGLAEVEAAFIARASAPDAAVAPFELLTVCDDPAIHLACARAWWAARSGGARARPARAPARRDRIRLGYLCSDFRAHATSVLAAGLFEAHDRHRFEVLAYSTGVDDGSAMRRRLEAAFDRFVDLTRLSDASAADLIAADGVDVLVDMNGLTEGVRPRLLERRPAGVAVHFLTYPGTTGIAAIDYIVADRFVLPAGEERNYTEAVVRLPHSYQVNDRARPIDPRTPARAACGLPEDGFVFCCFNGAAKIGPASFDIWMRLLAAVPGSVLWLLSPGEPGESNLRREAAARGVEGGRLVFAAKIPGDEHRARARNADLFLDTLPYNAHTTTSDALWAGVPVLTCPGRSFAARVAGSLLSAIGLPELIAPDLAAYESLALALARDRPRLAALRAKLAAHRLTTPLFDTERFARDIERAYVTMVERARRGEKPLGFDLD